jgi:hypothetical protein
VRVVVRTHEPPAAKLLRLLVKDLRVNSRREILPTYRVVTDAVYALPSSMGRTGFEPRTSSLSGKLYRRSLLRVVRLRPPVSTAVSGDRYAVGYSPPCPSLEDR